jgi:hypothetical protein
MEVTARQVSLFILLLLGAAFLALQFHYCCDLTSSPSAAHICPVCSVAGSAIITPSPDVAIVPVANPLEVSIVVASPFMVLPHATSPRAPPAS